MSKEQTRYSMLRTAFSRTHLVDKCLLLFMGVLLVQSAMALFGSPNVSNEINSIDIIIRTSTAGIFGYFLSANFIRSTPRSDSAPRPAPEMQALPPVQMPPPAPTPAPAPLPTSAPTPTFVPTPSQMLALQAVQAVTMPADAALPAVFSPSQTLAPAAQSATPAMQNQPSEPDEVDTEGRLQIIVATSIGLFCLLMLIICRHMLERNVGTVSAPSAAAIVAQFRDFVSSCVGFLIGSPTEMRKRS